MVLDFHDETLTEALNYIFSGLLPHENYTPNSYGLLFSTLKSVLKTEDVRGLHYIFYVIFDKYQALMTALPPEKFSVRITRTRFDNALANNLPDFILDPKLRLNELMAQEGKSADINIPTVQQEAMGVVYEKVMALYDECFDIGASYEDAMSRVVDLKDIIKANLIETGLGQQRVIMSTGLRLGKRTYRGPEGWLMYVQNLSRELSEMEKADENDLVCDGIEFIPQMDARSVELSSPLGTYGVPQLDNATPMLRHRLTVLVARENTGKTQVCIHLIASLIRSGVKPFFGCGESSKEMMFNSIVSSYIFQEYNMFFETQYLSGSGYETLTPEDQQIVNTAKARVASSGLVISNNLTYDNVTSKIMHYHQAGCEAFFIDHTQSLRDRKNRPIGDLVTGLALDCRQLKNDLPIYICLVSQPSSGLKDLLQKDQAKGVQLSPTAQSATPSNEADEVFILYETEFLKTRGLLAWMTYKRRGAEKPPVFYILKHFEVSAYTYDAKYQGVESVDGDTLAGIVSGIVAEEEDVDDEDAIDIDF